MGTLWRSEDMTLVQITMQREAAHDTVAAFGDLGLIEFKDVISTLFTNQNSYQLI
jgi:V-type H+-transporting ATPase subunit a